MPPIQRAFAMLEPPGLTPDARDADEYTRAPDPERGAARARPAARDAALGIARRARAGPVDVRVLRLADLGSAHTVGADLALRVLPTRVAGAVRRVPLDPHGRA